MSDLFFLILFAFIDVVIIIQNSEIKELKRKVKKLENRLNS